MLITNQNLKFIKIYIQIISSLSTKYHKKYDKQNKARTTIGKLSERATSMNGWDLTFRPYGDRLINCNRKADSHRCRAFFKMNKYKWTRKHLRVIYYSQIYYRKKHILKKYRTYLANAFVNYRWKICVSSNATIDWSFECSTKH